MLRNNSIISININNISSPELNHNNLGIINNDPIHNLYQSYLGMDNNNINNNPFNYSQLTHNTAQIYDLLRISRLSAQFADDFDDDLSRNGVRESLIDKLPLMKVDDKLIGDNKKCIICLEVFEKDNDVLILPCLHMFHEKCIKEWLLINNLCPICKCEVKNYQDDFSIRNSSNMHLSHDDYSL